MNVLMVEPGKASYETQIIGDLRSMQQAVGGYIEAVYPFEEPVALLCNEDGMELVSTPSKRNGWRFFVPAEPLLPAVRTVSGIENGAFLRSANMDWRCFFPKGEILPCLQAYFWR